ncbi:hypothetical protein QLG13_07855 [Rhodococcus aetherivorans]|uniref:hypothetical protein n=1 Tax=Rhodococcus aetherivorans TaxID=191292 RepID=UPI003EC15373
MSYDIAAGETIAGAQWGDTTLPDWVIEPARRTVASNARNADDALVLLQMLGLIDTPTTERAVDTHHAESQPTAKPTACRECHRTFRPKGTSKTEHPGTVMLSGLGLCGACYGRQHNAKPADQRGKQGARRRDDIPINPVNGCKTCHRALRPCKTPLQQQPNTVEHVAHGLCKACYKAARKGVAA